MVDTIYDLHDVSLLFSDAVFSLALAGGGQVLHERVDDSDMQRL